MCQSDEWATREEVAALAEVVNNLADAMTEICDVLEDLAKDDHKQRLAIHNMVESQQAMIAAIRIVAQR